MTYNANFSETTFSDLHLFSRNFDVFKLLLFFNLKAEILIWKIFATGEHKFIDIIIICIHSFLLNNVFVAGNKLNMKRNKTGFILYTPDFPPLNSRVKK